MDETDHPRTSGQTQSASGGVSAEEATPFIVIHIDLPIANAAPRMAVTEILMSYPLRKVTHL
jgi:hypothetical protein